MSPPIRTDTWWVSDVDPIVGIFLAVTVIYFFYTLFRDLRK